ncbi:MAG TPA: hypothetical protein VIJ00_12365 [Nakamurella sp.]
MNSFGGRRAKTAQPNPLGTVAEAGATQVADAVRGRVGAEVVGGADGAAL